MEISINNNKTVILNPVRKNSDNNKNIFELRDNANALWMEIEIVNGTPNILFKDNRIDEDETNLSIKLDELILKIIEAEQSGTEVSETETIDYSNPFNPEDIKVHAKQFSLRLISDMIDEGDIDLSPDFQRNLVWSSFQKSRLIESILLRIPLPMFYFSEDNVGRITIVDGLQRLSTIKEFMENKFPLRNLEYLKDSCEGKYYKDSGKKKGIDPKYLRWFNQTQFSVNVIDSSSPSKVKYDIFRRINTGGKPLNNQEIRNCLSGKELRDTIREMANLEEFKNATDYSIKPTRMEDQEVAMRFILFYRFIEQDGTINGYNGYMNPSLDYLPEELSNYSKEDLKKYVFLYSNAMRNAEYLFGRKFAFRKVRLNDIKPNSYKQLINKALFVCWSILLADYNPEQIKKSNEEMVLLEPLAKNIEEDIDLLNFLSYGTNGKSNLLYVFNSAKKIINEYL